MIGADIGVVSEVITAGSLGSLSFGKILSKL